MQGSIYVLSSLGLYRWIPGGAPEPLLNLSHSQRNLSPTPPDNQMERDLWERGLKYLFTDGEALFGLHPYSGQVFKWEGQSFIPFARIPQSQFTYTDEEKTYAKEIKSLVFTQGRLYLSLMSTTAREEETRELFAWDLHAPAMDLLNAPGAEDIYPGPPGELLVRLEASRGVRSTLWRYDILAQALTAMVWDEAVEPAAGCVWREADQSLYFTAEGGKVKKALPGGKTQTKAYLPISYVGPEDRAFLTAGGEYVYQKTSLFVRDLSLPGERQQRSVTVMGYINPSIAVAFSARRPDISLILEDGDMDFLSIQESMVSGDTDVDLYIVHSARVYRKEQEGASCYRTFHYRSCQLHNPRQKNRQHTVSRLIIKRLPSLGSRAETGGQFSIIHVPLLL